jgi:hypothetical protein
MDVPDATAEDFVSDAEPGRNSATYALAGGVVVRTLADDTTLHPRGPRPEAEHVWFPHARLGRTTSDEQCRGDNREVRTATTSALSSERSETGGYCHQRGQLGFVGGERPAGHVQFCGEVEGCHQWSSFGGGGSRQHPKGRAHLVESELTK